MAKKGRIESIVDIAKIEGEIKTLTTSLQTILTKVEGIAVASAKIKFEGFDKAKNIKEAADASEKLNKTTNDAIKAEKELDAVNAAKKKKLDELNAATIALDKQRQKSIADMAKEESAIKKAGEATLKRIGQESSYFKELKKTSAEKEKSAAAAAKLKAKEDELNAALKLEVKTVGDALRQNKALNAIKLTTITTSGKQSQAIQNLNTKIQQNTEFIRANGTMADRQRMNIGNYGSALKGVGMQLMGALGITAGIYGFVRAIGSAIKTAKDFEKQSATLAGVLDVEKTQITALTKQAIQLGGIYPTMASEVLDLQTAYARLGFSQQEILNLTEPTIKGSFALNAELGDTAELVGAVVKAYDELASTDAGMIIDQLTKSTQKSSLNFEALKTALPKVAGAANALNIPLNETLAVLGTSIDATQDASVAGTSFRKILLSNAAAGRDLADGLEIIQNSTNKVKTAQELYGDRAAVVALALANQTEKTKLLADEIENSLGVANRTAKKQMDTFGGAIQGVSSSWERLILTFNNSGGTLKNVANWFSKMLDNIVDVTEASDELSRLKIGSNLNALQKFPLEEAVKAALKNRKELSNLDNQTIQDHIDKYTIMLSEIANSDTKYNNNLKVVYADQLQYLNKTLQDRVDERNKIEYDAARTKQIKLNELLLTDETDAKERARLFTEIENIKYQNQVEDAKGAKDKIELLTLDHEQNLKDINNALLDSEKEMHDKSFKMFATDVQLKIIAVEEQAKAYKEEGILEADIARWVAQEKGKIYKDANDKELEARVALVTAKRKLEEEFTNLVGELDNEYIKSLEDELKAGEEKLKSENEILEDQLKEQAKIRDENREEQLEKDKEAADQRKEIESGVLNGVVEGIGIINEAYQNSINQQIDDLETQKEYELSLTNLSEEEKDKINEKYAAKEKALKTKADNANKIAAGIKAAINTFLAITSALTVPPPAGFILAGIAGALGAAQIAAIASTKLPKYFKGREGGPAEFAITGDRGSEIIDIPNRGQFLTPNRSTLTFLSEGASVIPHAETMERLSNPGLRQMENISAMDIRLLNEVNSLHKGFTMLADVVKNKKEFNLNITEKGMYLAVKNGESWVKYVNENINM